MTCMASIDHTADKLTERVSDGEENAAHDPDRYEGTETTEGVEEVLAALAEADD